VATTWTHTHTHFIICTHLYLCLHLPGYSLWNLSAVYFVTSNVKLAAKIENLFDKEYETAGGYSAPERGYYINATYEF